MALLRVEDQRHVVATLARCVVFRLFHAAAAAADRRFTHARFGRTGRIPPLDPMVNAMAPLPAVRFQGQDPEERFLFYFRQHWIRLVWPLTRMLFWSAGLALIGWILFFLIGIADPAIRHWLLGLLLMIFTLTQWEFLMRLYVHFLYVIIVTDKKIHRIKKTLFSVDDHQCLDLAAFQDMHKVQRGVVQNTFGFGTLILEAQETQLRIHFTPGIKRIYERLLEVRGNMPRSSDD